MEKGLQRLQQGLELGQHRATARMILRLIERRFGPPDQALRARIEAADQDTLPAWYDRLLDGGSPEEVLH